MEMCIRDSWRSRGNYSEIVDCVISRMQMEHLKKRVDEIFCEVDKELIFLSLIHIYGVPPHAGLAFGVDRICMHMLHTDNIKAVSYTHLDVYKRQNLESHLNVDALLLFQIWNCL